MALTREVKAGLVTAAATLAVGLLALNQALVGVFYDDGLYAGLATALASGHGYVHPNLPGMPGAVHYPPLYPAILTPLFGLLSVHAAATGAAQHQRGRSRPAVVRLGHHVDDLVEGAADEIHELELGHGTQPVVR